VSSHSENHLHIVHVLDCYVVGDVCSGSHNSEAGRAWLDRTRSSNSSSHRHQPFSRIRLCSRCRHWLTALSMIRWSQRSLFLKQSFFQTITSHIGSGTLALTKCSSPDRSRRLTEATYQCFLRNSGIIFLALYPSSTLRPFIKIISSSDNILFISLSVSSRCACNK